MSSDTKHMLSFASSPEKTAATRLSAYVFSKRSAGTFPEQRLVIEFISLSEGELRVKVDFHCRVIFTCIRT